MIDEAFELNWQMTNCEKFALIRSLQNLQPAVAIEVGTYQGGSLQVISRYASEVVSIDIDPTISEQLSGLFGNVRFFSGDSSHLLSQTLQSYAGSDKKVGFILIDGDHSTEGVRRDIKALLEWKPEADCVVLFHDAFNPACREGIRTAGWGKSPYVHSVELDYVPGIYHEHAYDTAQARSMWGGFARAILRSAPRQGPLDIEQSQQGLFNAVYAVSSHRPLSFMQRVKRRLTRVISL
jgi:cephalosporin hydroxylase